jgi:multidrug efflux system membrane fusion protein
MTRILVAILACGIASAQTAPAYDTYLGAVAGSVVVKPLVDGELISVSFREGEQVQAGQVLATIDPRPYRIQLAQAEGQLAQDQAAQIEARIKTDLANVEHAKLLLTYTQVTAPMTGVTGLRKVDPGNIVHASDDGGIVVITRLKPAVVVFGVPFEKLAQLRARLNAGAHVEAWNREFTRRIATGRLSGIDNQVDPATGTVKAKAVFENRDGALLPNQYVNVRVPLGPQ